MTTVAPITQRLGRTLLASQHLTVAAQIIRVGEGSRNDFGEWVPGTETPEDINVITEPMSGQDREQLAEGLREADGRIFYLMDAAVAIEAGETGGDRIRFLDKTWQVVRLQEWGGFRKLFTVVPEAEPEDKDE